MTKKTEEQKNQKIEEQTEVKDEPALGEVSSKTEGIFDFRIDLNEMLKAGVYFGHRASRTHPKMLPYIYGVRNTVHVIDLEKSAQKLHEVLGYLKENFAGKPDKMILFVGTTPPAKAQVKELAASLSMPYVVERWLGGTLTNFETIAKRIEYFRQLSAKKESGEFEKYTKKEQHKLNLELQKLEQKMGGLKSMIRLPDLVFIVDLRKDYLAAKEARMKGIPTMAFCDTNVDPTTVDWPIPANDDAISSIKYILGKAAEALKT